MNGCWKSNQSVIRRNFYKKKKQKEREENMRKFESTFSNNRLKFSVKTWKKFSEETPLWVDMHGEDNDVLKDHSEHSAW